MRPSAIYNSVLPHTSCPGAVEHQCYHIYVEDRQEEGWACPVVVGKLSESNDFHEDTGDRVGCNDQSPEDLGRSTR